MKMIKLLSIGLLFVGSLLCTGEETRLSCLTHQEWNIAKFVRLDFRLEQLERIVNDTAARSQKKECPTCKQCPDNWIQFKGSCYLVVHKLYSYDDARTHCIELGAHLVKIESSRENKFIQTLVGWLRSSTYWLGLSDVNSEGRFQWDDGDDVSLFTDWSPGQPDNHGGNEDCANTYHAYDYQWNDSNCGTKIKFICEM